MWASVVRGASLSAVAVLLAGCINVIRIVEPAPPTPPPNDPFPTLTVADIEKQSGLIDTDAAGSTMLNGDQFLTRVRFDPDYADVEHHRVYRYEERRGNTIRVGYGVTGKPSASMPTTGAAQYSGNAVATMVGSVTGRSDVEGNFQMRASFTPKGGTVEGDISFAAMPISIQMLPTAIKGSGFKGKLGATKPPTGWIPPSPPDAYAVSQGHYRGTFFDNRGREVGGTFGLNVHGVPTSCGVFGTPCTGSETVKIVGGFSGKR